MQTDFSSNFEPDYEALFDKLPEGAFTIDTDWRITSFNQTAANITGFSRDDVLGCRCWDIFRSDLCKKGCPLGTAMETGNIRTDQEVAIRDRNGTRRQLLVNVNTLRNPDGMIIGAIETFRLPDRNSCMQTTAEHAFEGMIGKSAAMRSVFAMLPDVAASEASVLICGESGTGKELLAKAVHNRSKRRKGPFVAINCSALAESLLESELFGHEKGAFTGAEQSKPGRFELAKGGTLFLDEIGELKPALQVKLLRVIEQRVFERVGGTKQIRLDARIISATNRDLAKAMKESNFREDLFYRLRTVPFTIPPLRDRAEDIPLLTDHFIKQFNVRYDRRVRSIDPKMMRSLMRYNWPGNVRELERCIEHAFVFVKGPVIFERHLPEILNPDDIIPTPFSPFPTGGTHDKNTILSALTRAGGNRQNAAELLGISRTSLWRRMKELGNM